MRRYTGTPQYRDGRHLPKVRARWTPAAKSPDATEMRRPRLDSNRSKAILVVDDDSGMRASLHFLLASCGFEVLDFASPDELFTSLDGAQLDCAVFDVHLPGIDGIEAYRRLKALRPGLPAIFITGQVDDQMRAEAKDVDAVALLEKPFSDDVLLDAVERALKHTDPA